MTISWGIHPTPFGQAFLAVSERGVSRLAFLESGDTTARDRALLELEKAWPGIPLVQDPDATAIPLMSIFYRGGRRAGDAPSLNAASGDARAGTALASEASSRPGPLSLYLKGTDFQLHVWRALLEVPTGSVTTYGRLAAALGRPGAARAVGGAVGANPVAYVIPCHRVVRATGELGGYRWGVERKRAMLEWEGGGTHPEERPRSLM
jgi:AraC family transcriptional regulator, regulatory protein of adaptative response / methylated-DNA-[protein]-cysteine methyltransferase